MKIIDIDINAIRTNASDITKDLIPYMELMIKKNINLIPIISTDGVLLSGKSMLEAYKNLGFKNVKVGELDIQSYGDMLRAKHRSLCKKYKQNPLEVFKEEIDNGIITKEEVQQRYGDKLPCIVIGSKISFITGGGFTEQTYRCINELTTLAKDRKLRKELYSKVSKGEYTFKSANKERKEAKSNQDETAIEEPKISKRDVKLNIKPIIGISQTKVTKELVLRTDSSVDNFIKIYNENPEDPKVKELISSNLINILNRDYKEIIQDPTVNYVSLTINELKILYRFWWPTVPIPDGEKRDLLHLLRKSLSAINIYRKIEEDVKSRQYEKDYEEAVRALDEERKNRGNRST